MTAVTVQVVHHSCSIKVMFSLAVTITQPCKAWSWICVLSLWYNRSV